MSKDRVAVSSHNDERPKVIFPSVEAKMGPTAESERRLSSGYHEPHKIDFFFYFGSYSGVYTIEDPSRMPVLIGKAVSKESRVVGVSENDGSSTDRIAGAYTGYGSVPDSDHYHVD